MTNLINRILKTLLVLLIPVLVILGSARLLATDAYLSFEYGKASFPPDSYGFTSQRRFEFASTNVHYVRAHLPDDTLSFQTLDGKALYNPREISHMADVRLVFQAILRVWQVAVILLLALTVLFWQEGERTAFASAIQSGGLLTSGIILAIALLAVFAWQSWFDLFHRFFFVEGSWLFSYSDTLIRLFPAKFWFDATLTISVLSLVGGLAFALAGWRLARAIARVDNNYLHRFLQFY